jgi:hypothetical protein
MIRPSRPDTGDACTNRGGPAVQAGGHRNERRAGTASYQGCICRGLSNGVVGSGWDGADQNRATTATSMTTGKIEAEQPVRLEREIGSRAGHGLDIAGLSRMVAERHADLLDTEVDALLKIDEGG